MLPGLLLKDELKQASLSGFTCRIPFQSQNTPAGACNRLSATLDDLLRPLQVLSSALPEVAAAGVYTLQGADPRPCRGLQQACN